MVIYTYSMNFDEFLDIALAISYELLAEQFSQTNFDSIFANISQ